ncbi:MAG: hypothetical protein C4533_07790 [Candidatus Omnitrophota bacterium]|jgi:hypothetical protein|nr:MAG: hypothetical protein C4533_07790 [Candidatus Omnitrophota bacterium]
MENNKGWTKFITPVLVTIAIFMLGNITMQLSRLEDRVFQHLANDQIHAPRSQFVSKAEFDLHCKFSEKENGQILKAIDDLRNDLKVKSRDERNQ